MNETNKTNLNRTGIKKTNIGEGISPNHRRNESISMRNLLKDKCWRMDLFSKVPTSRKQKRIQIRTQSKSNPQQPIKQSLTHQSPSQNSFGSNSPPRPYVCTIPTEADQPRT